jgi:hypothetical protein
MCLESSSELKQSIGGGEHGNDISRGALMVVPPVAVSDRLSFQLVG